MTEFTFSDLVFQPRQHLTGIQAVAFFPNGYGASVIKGYGTYGDAAGCYELAVIEGNEDDWSLCYDTPVTNDVLGWLETDDVTTLLQQIAALPARQGASVS